MIDNHTDCLFVTEHLVKVFEARQLEIQEEILGIALSVFINSKLKTNIVTVSILTTGYESVGQLAVDFTDSQRRLAEKAIEEGIQEMLDARPPAPEGMSSKPTRSRNIDLPEFFAICDVFYDIAPQIRVSATATDFCYLHIDATVTRLETCVTLLVG